MARALGATNSQRCLARPTTKMRNRAVLPISNARQPISTPANEASTSKPCELVTLEEVTWAARRRGLSITVKELGPFYRIVCRDGDSTGRVVGVTSGFTAPLFGIMHCDMLQIFTRGLKGEDGQRLRGGPLGLGLLMGAATFAFGHQRGCRVAEILAINDDDAWHERLVRYYSYFGFRPVGRVGGNGLRDVPHLLVWGGEGTRMDADIQALLRRWSPALRQNSLRTSGGGGGAGGGGEDGGDVERI
ncbi:hypothetical protein Agub_g5798 [Astrephomene gubernaculifera]|uniref:Uncharacterized protein n=1 Tax=Astrephomene gubernaculifera TaxID=47775 RepID=A0AAD3DPV2_9CHLO|nr:hypothetical protein Agub_g5798 [Astrephomene gubernaculifera]